MSLQETVDLEVTHVLLVRDNVVSQMQGSDLVQVHLQSLETTTTMCGDKVARKPVLVNVARETIRVRKQKQRMSSSSLQKLFLHKYLVISEKA